MLIESSNVHYMSGRLIIYYCDNKDDDMRNTV